MAEALMESVCERALLETEVRVIDEDQRRATFIAATENGVQTWQGLEYLRMSGVQLQRYRRNPVVLDTHDRWTAGAVIGRAAVKVNITTRALEAEVTFAETDRADEIWQLVKSGFVRAVSVGFIADDARVVELMEGEIDGEGDSEIVGPARVIKSWELYEISIVPVPADSEALRRSFLHGENIKLAPVAQSILNILERLVLPSAGKDKDMAEEKKADAKENVAELKAVEMQGFVEDSETRALRVERERAETIRAIAPKDLSDLAEDLILESISLDDARKRFQEARAKRTPAVGTPEPKGPEAKSKTRGKIESVSERDLTAAILG